MQTQEHSEQTSGDSTPHPVTTVRSLKELLDIASGRSVQSSEPAQDSGIAELVPFPFLALVGQEELKLSLLLTLINPAIGGVLLIGPRGTGKTTAVRSLLDLLPTVERSACFYGCTPEDIQFGGMDAVCPDCAKKYAEGIPLTRTDPVRLVELPLNARLEDVIGGLDERALVHDRMRLKRGILAQADLNILYIDEVNLISNEVVDSILDAAAQGSFTVKRGPMSATYRSRFTLIGSMNPEEGNLRPQIMDRFGLRVIVRGITEADSRLEVYRRVSAYRANPHQLSQQFNEQMQMARDELMTARALLPKVIIPTDVALKSIQIVRDLNIDSHRAEITLFEAARAYTAADSRTEVTDADIEAVALMSLRLRRSEFMNRYFSDMEKEEAEMKQSILHQNGSRE